MKNFCEMAYLGKTFECPNCGNHVCEECAKNSNGLCPHCLFKLYQIS